MGHGRGVEHSGDCMSLAATIWAWRQRDLSAPQKLVLLRLADHADEITQRCWPSQLNLSEFTALSERTVRGALKVLETKLLITRKRRGRGASRTSDLIYLRVSPPGKSPQKSRPVDPTGGDGTTDVPADGAGTNRQEQPVATGTACRLISHNEPPRQNLVPKVMLPLMPESGRADIDLHNRAVEFVATLRPDLDAHIDWSAAGIDDPSRIEAWLQHHDEKTLAAKIVRTLKRRGKASSASIRSWKYFEKEIFSDP
jgi:DNA-binding transcriptional ArsR family regulator